MPKPIHEMSSWGASTHPPRQLDDAKDDEWEATRQQSALATRLMRDKDEYLAAAYRHVGRQVGHSQWELFVACEPSDAMQQQFESLQPNFVALHDIGIQSSRRMLATASGRPVHQLQIRRQGLGMPLATIEFIELMCIPDQPPLRLYSTEVDADTAQRRRLARTLLAFSRLGVVMVGDLPPHALTAALLPIRDAIAEGPWLNRDLLLLPLAGAAALAGQAAHIARGSSVKVLTTPLVTRPAEAWSYMRASWQKLRTALAEDSIQLPDLLDPVRPGSPAAPKAAPSSQATAPAAAAPEPARPPTPATAAAQPPAKTPLPMQPMPTVRAVEPPAPADPALATYLRKCGELKGMLSCCIFELATQRTLGHAGARPGPAALASHGASLMASMAEASHAMNLGDAPPDAAITLGTHHLILRTVPGRHGLALHAVLDKAQSNLTLVRLQLQRLDLLLEERAGA
jgi:hypothetical protein